MLENELVRQMVQLRRQMDSLVKPEVPRRGGVAAYNNANLPVNSGVFTALNLNSERWDDADFHSVVVNTSRLTVPAGYAGCYSIAGHFVFDANVNGVYRMGLIYLNGATYIAGQSAPFTTGGWVYITVGTEYDLADGDFVQLVAGQDSGVPVNVLSLGNYSPEFRMERVG